MATVTEPSHTVPHARSIDIDVVRAVALIGVAVMNYHGYLNGGAAADDESFFGNVFDPWQGPLSTRFAATFVTVAGIGVALLARRAIASRDRAAIDEIRWILVRRGVLLFAFGYFLDWIWPGTILFFYGAYFVVGAAIVTLRSRWVLAIGIAAALAGAALHWWAIHHKLTWLLSGESERSHSPRDLFFDVTVRGTHPLLPWLVFFCIGIVLGRLIPWRTELQLNLAFAGVLAVIVGYALAGNLPWDGRLQTTYPFDRGLLYTLTTVGSSLVAVFGIGAIARATSESAITRALAVAGRTTLSLYVLHVLVFNLVVNQLDWIDRESGLATALVFAMGFWVVAVLLANWWNRMFPMGPLEWLYRRFSD